MKKILMKTISIFLITILLSTSIIYAVSNNDSQILQNKIDDTKEKIDDVKEEKSDTLKEVEELTRKISEYENEIENLNKQTESLNNKIADNERQIQEKQEEYNQKEELLKERLVIIYEEGETSFLDMMLSAKNITEFISTYFLIEEITSCETDMMKSIEQSKQEIENAQKELENTKTEIENVKKQKESKNNELQSAKTEKNEYAKKLTSQEQQLQKDLEEFENDKKAIDNELAEIARKAAEEQRKREEEQKRKEEENKQNQGSSNNSGAGSNTNTGNNTSSSGGVSSKGFICPIPGLSKANITCGFYGYTNHGGADFGGNYGKTIVAAKSVTVVISKTTTGNIPNYDLNGNIIGYYRSYGEYIAIDHHDGSITLYAHGLPGSRKVSYGQEVKQGQAIMTVGNTGNVNPRPTPSNPKGGAHLHFEIMINGTKVNPALYL